MTFTVRDLMLDVLPASDANAYELRICELASQAQPKPKPKPKPKPRPDCTMETALGGPSGIEARAELVSLAVLREQLQQVLHP